VSLVIVDVLRVFMSAYTPWVWDDHLGTSTSRQNYFPLALPPHSPDIVCKLWCD